MIVLLILCVSVMAGFVYHAFITLAEIEYRLTELEAWMRKNGEAGE